MRSLRRFQSFLAVTVAVSAIHLVGPEAWSQDDMALEPYSVYVAKDGIYAHCGPSEEFYRTDPLRHGLIIL